MWLCTYDAAGCLLLLITFTTGICRAMPVLSWYCAHDGTLLVSIVASGEFSDIEAGALEAILTILQFVSEGRQSLILSL